jgi:hypothetical protein
MEDAAEIRQPQKAEAFRQRSKVGAIFRRAMERGELDETDHEVLEDYRLEYSGRNFFEKEIKSEALVNFCFASMMRGYGLKDSDLFSEISESFPQLTERLKKLKGDAYLNLEKPEFAEELEVYSKKFGRKKLLGSFEEHLKSRVIDLFEEELFGVVSEEGKVVREGFFSDGSEKHLDKIIGYTERALLTRRLLYLYARKALPKMERIVQEAEKLGIKEDLFIQGNFSEEIAFAFKAEEWGERPHFDYPETDAENLDPLNPLNKIAIKDNSVEIATLNPNLKTDALESAIKDFLQVRNDLQNSGMVGEEIDEWTIRQVIWRDFITKNEKVEPTYVDLDNYSFSRLIGDAKQVSNRVEVWKHSDSERRVIVKFCPEHTLQADFVGQRFLKLMGIPTPETNITEHEGRKVLVIGFLEKYYEEEDPFSLSERYQFDQTIQQGILTDLWLGQYNRRPHNIMMKDGKVAFIDHGGSLNSRATGGHKGFSSEVSKQDLQDYLRCIPDDNPDGDEPVNEAYGRVLTIENGEIIVGNETLLQRLLRRVKRISDEQIEDIVDHADYEDGSGSIERMERFLKSDAIEGRISRLKHKQAFIEQIEVKVAQEEPILADILHCLEVTTSTADGRKILEEIEKKEEIQSVEKELGQIREQVDQALYQEMKKMAGVKKVRENLWKREYFKNERDLDSFMKRYFLAWVRAGWTRRDAVDLRWTEQAVEMYQQAINAGGLKTYLQEVLKERKKNLIRFFEAEVGIKTEN